MVGVVIGSIRTVVASAVVVAIAVCAAGGNFVRTATSRSGIGARAGSVVGGHFDSKS
jgi:hypothetical protein